MELGGLYTVDSFVADTVTGLELMSLLARVRNSESLFQSNVLYFVFTWDLAAVRFIGVSVIAGCPQGES